MTVSDEKRCTYHFIDNEKNRGLGRVGERCGRPAEPNGTGRCKFHGGKAPAMIDKVRQAEFEAEIRRDRRFTDLVPADDARLDPFSLLLWEIRRSLGRIDYLDDKINELAEEKSLWWGMTKQEEISASEFAGTNRTYEARENILVKMQNDERKRLFDMEKEWQSNKFEATKIMAMGEFGTYARLLVTRLVQELGHDLTDQDTQEAIARVLGAMPALQIESRDPTA